jgi:long-subunit acyl-CoA synthetase (AMP-forming)
MMHDEVSGFYDIFIKLKSNGVNTFGFFSDTGGEKTIKTFAQLHEDIRLCYNNLIKLGINANSTVGLNIDNRYYFFVCDFALILLGVVTLLHSKNDPVELLKGRLVQFQVDYLVSQENVPEAESLCPIIKLQTLFNPDTPGVEVKKYSPKKPDISICFSSGTTGIPKGMGVSEHGSIETARWFFKWMEFSYPDKFLIYLPLASYQQRFLIWGCLIKNVDIVLVDDKTLFRGLQEFQPTILLAPPNFYFNLYRMNTGSRFKQIIRKILPHNKKNKLLRLIASTYTYKPLYQTLGGRTRYLITGMAPIDMKILEHFREAYLDIFQIYGQTEIGMIACNKTDANQLGTVGKPIIPLHLSEEDDEIITNSDFPTINSYYLEKNNKIQRVPLGKKRPTGDVGMIDENGYLTIKGRKNETIILKSGIKINPAVIENKLKPKMTNIEEVLIFKSNHNRMKTDLNVVILAKSNQLDLENINEMIGNEHELKQSSEKVSVFTYCIKKEDRKVMYTENNKFSRVRTIELLKKNYQKLERVN